MTNTTDNVIVGFREKIINVFGYKESLGCDTDDAWFVMSGEKDGKDMIDAMESFISQSLEEAKAEGRREERELTKNGIEKTFTGCACGLHVYLVLPDCEKEKHPTDKCARCFLDSSITNQVTKK